MNEAAKSILGRDGYATIFVTDQYYTLLCFKSLTLDIEDEEIENTTPASGRARTYTTGLSSGICTINGLTTIENTDAVVSLLYMLQHRNEVHQVQIVLTSADTTAKSIAFNAIIRRSTLTNDVSQWSQSSIEFRISGDVDTGAIIDPPVAPVLFSDYWTTTPGAFTVTGTSVEHGYSLSGITPIGVYREGVEYDLTLGTPGNRQAKYVSGTPAIQFQSTAVFNAGETVFIIFTE